MASIRLRQLTRRCGEVTTAMALLDRDIRFHESSGFVETAVYGWPMPAAPR